MTRFKQKSWFFIFPYVCGVSLENSVIGETLRVKCGLNPWEKSNKLPKFNTYPIFEFIHYHRQFNSYDEFETDN